MFSGFNQLIFQSSSGKEIKEHKRLKIEAYFRAFICILLMFFSIYFTPDFVANNFSPHGILEQITVFKISYIRLAFSILSTIGLLVSALCIIKPNSLYLLQLKIFNKQNATLFLTLILCVDFALFVVSSISFFTPYLNYEVWSLGKDRQIPEIYQYIKWSWIIILLIHTSKIKRSFSYATWVIVFTYLLFDDAMRIHERVGHYFANNLDFIPPFGLRPQDIGELAFLAIVGMILLLLVGWAYLNGNQTFKKMSQIMLLLIFALVFFGVGADMAHVAIKVGGKKMNFILVVIEDGGEMVVTSLILWYAFLLSTQYRITSSSIYHFHLFSENKNTTLDRFFASP